MDEHGAIDLFVSNAGYVTVGGLEDDDSEMQKMFDVTYLFVICFYFSNWHFLFDSCHICNMYVFTKWSFSM